MPTDIGTIDLMIGFARVDESSVYDFLRPSLKDEETASGKLTMPAGYMFKEIPDTIDQDRDAIDTTTAEMDRWGIVAGLFGLDDRAREASRRYPGRVYFRMEVDPNDVMETIRRVKQTHADEDLKAVSVFPAGCRPQVPVDDPKMYALYATCVELDIPVVVNAGIAGPRVPSACQDVARFDPVCYDFPDLRIVMRHGAEPWEKLAMKLMLKWPNLYYMTSAFAPRHYPEAIIDYANTRGADKIMYAGYYPSGLTLERIFTELPEVPFRDHVWPKFLRENATRVFGLAV
jgi:predicted TIM-barrel fold metal-dependent hydrolase